MALPPLPCRPAVSPPPRRRPAIGGHSRRRVASQINAAASQAAALPASLDDDAAASSAGPLAQPVTDAVWQPPHFADLPLDRAAGLRREPERLAQLLAAPSSRVLLLHNGNVLVTTGPVDGTSSASSGGSPQLLLQPQSYAAPAGTPGPDGAPPRWVLLLATPQQLRQATESLMGDKDEQKREQQQQQFDFLFLGLDASGSAVFAAPAPHVLLPLLPPVPVRRGAGSSAPSGQPRAAAAPPSIAAEAGCDGQQAQWVDVRREGQHMAGPDAAVAALASALGQWHASAAYCSRTGVPTVSSLALPLGGEGGRALSLIACLLAVTRNGLQHPRRTDPPPPPPPPSPPIPPPM